MCIIPLRSIQTGNGAGVNTHNKWTNIFTLWDTHR